MTLPPRLVPTEFSERKKNPKLDEIFQVVANLGPGHFDQWPDKMRDAIVELGVRVQKLERQNNMMISAIQKDLLAIAEHCPHVLAASAEITIINHMEDSE